MGNELAKDDGVGMRLGRILECLALPENAEVRFYPQIDLNLIDDILAAERLVICDATRLGVAPGTVTLWPWESVAELSKRPFCCHGIGLEDLLRIAKELTGRTTSWDIYVLGVEARTVDEYGLELSPEVQAALPSAIQKLLELIYAPADLVQRGVALALALPPPNPLTAFGG